MNEAGNNHGEITPQGGRGSIALADLYDAKRARGAAGILATAIKYGYLDAFCVDYQEVKAAAKSLLTSDSDRVRAAGAKLLTEMAKHDLDLVMALDKNEKIETGGVTERTEVEHTVYTCQPPRVIGSGGGE